MSASSMFAATLAAAASVPLRCPAGSGGQSCSINRTIIPLCKTYDAFSNLALRTPLLTGWHGGMQDSDYVELIRENNVSVAIEIGVWRGLSASSIAKALKTNGNGGVLFAVDTWLGAPEFWNLRITEGAPDPRRDMFLINGYPSVYYTFLSNMVHSGVHEYIVPLPMTSRMAARLLTESKRFVADLIHLDAAHEYEDIKEDIELWLPLLTRCGLLLFDDVQNGWEGVDRAIDEFMNSHQSFALHRVAKHKAYAQRRSCKHPGGKHAPVRYMDNDNLRSGSTSSNT